MDESKQYIAVDFGAESGRVMLGTISTGGKLVLEEMHRFSNGPIEVDGSLRWDFDRLLSETKAGIKKAVAQAKGKISGIGVDSWGVDFGLIGPDGRLLERPYNYRDCRTDGMMEKAFEMMDKRSIYGNTGIQFMQINTIFQLLSMKLGGAEVLEKTDKLIFIADLVTYFLCGEIFAEYSLASTSGLMDMSTGQWSETVFESLGLPIDIMPRIVKPGTKVGQLRPEICDELGCGPIDCFAVGSHDTASAVAAVPAEGDNWAYLSSGTWSLMGIETPDAIINDDSFGHAFTNEGGVCNTVRFLKNIMGLWLLQQSKKQWAKEGEDLDYATLTKMASQAGAFAGYVDCNCEKFLSPGDMQSRINEYLEQTGQGKIKDKGQIVRVILESLALKYRSEMESMEKIASKKIDVLHIVGGGTKNELLNQLTANATGKKVITGPIEATASGNLLMQAIAVGQIASLDEGRELVRRSFDIKEYTPQRSGLWEKQYEIYKSITE